jgi:hypothetical protein
VRREDLERVGADLGVGGEGGREHLRDLVAEQLLDRVDDFRLGVGVDLEDLAARVRGHLAHVRRRVTRALLERHELDLHDLAHAHRRQHAQRRRAHELVRVREVARKGVDREQRELAALVVKVRVRDEVRVDELLELDGLRLQGSGVGAVGGLAVGEITRAARFPAERTITLRTTSG